MAKLQIKICGIRGARMAASAVEAGANFIGIVCHPGSKRFVNLSLARQIAKATRSAGGIPVAVFVDHSMEQILALCEETGITTVQLHGERSRAEQSNLPQYLQRIYVCPVTATGPVIHGLTACDPQRDYVLFDHAQAGSGRMFDWNTIQYSGPYRMGIAGGLRANNVQAAVMHLQPSWVDVSSGVEGHSGEKDIHLVREFIQASLYTTNTETLRA